MEDTKWGTWLRAVTHQETERGIARVVGVSHTTVQRWIAAGVPPSTVWEITLRFNADPIATLVVMGRIAPDQVRQLNLAAVVKYADADVLTAELHSRAMREAVKSERSDAFDGAPFQFAERPRRSDAMRHKQFRLTNKM